MLQSYQQNNGAHFANVTRHPTLGLPTPSVVKRLQKAVFVASNLWNFHVNPGKLADFCVL